jgi:H+/Cl- antiporter ClcA
VSQGATPAPAPAAPAGGLDLAATLRSAGYAKLCLLAAIIGVPISAAAYGFSEGVTQLQDAFYNNLPHWFGYDSAPIWWPLPLLFVAGILVTFFIRSLPGNGGHCPADGFSAGATEPIALPGVLLAAAAGLAFGIVLGPEAPLIALGSGLGALAAKGALRGAANPMAPLVLAACGSFAALGTILGSPIVAAVFLMEAIGLGGETLTMVLLPGLLAGATGALIFIGLGHWGGLGEPTLSIPASVLPAYAHPSAADLGWAVVLGLAAALLVGGLRRVVALLRPHVEGRRYLLMPLAGLAVGGLAIGFQEWTHQSFRYVLFSGQSALGPLAVYSQPALAAQAHVATFTAATLAILALFKAAAYAISLSGFRGGPIFPSLLIGAAGGLAASHLPGFDLVSGLAVGMGAMTAAMLRLPFAAVLLSALVMGKAGIDASPVIIVGVVVARVSSEWFAPRPPASIPAPVPAPAPPTPSAASG